MAPIVYGYGYVHCLVIETTGRIKKSKKYIFLYLVVAPKVHKFKNNSLGIREVEIEESIKKHIFEGCRQFNVNLLKRFQSIFGPMPNRLNKN